MTTAVPGEDLAEAARLAREQAPRLCRSDDAGGSCAWHHGLWPTLRLLGLVTEPALHGEFLRGALASVPGQTPRILLSGAADHALLAQVLAAFPGRTPRITVLDLCETPLMLNRWYAHRAGAEIRTQRSDILDFDAPPAFEVICTHAFLGNFDVPRRAALASKWHALLAPGGRVVTVNRLRPGRVPRWIAFSPEQVRAYCARVEAAARSRGLRLPDLGRAAEVYATKQAIFPIGSTAEVKALFEGAGFTIETLSVASIAAEAHQPVNAPTVPGGDDYALLIAAKR
ncbi:MAG: trans-aconitate 2-methyltransferase [Burkholderiales bacterium]